VGQVGEEEMQVSHFLPEARNGKESEVSRQINMIRDNHLSESRSTKRKSSQKVGSAFGVRLGCNKRGRRLGEPSRNGSTGSPCVDGNREFIVLQLFFY
jgi:ribosomal protein L4